MYSTGVRQEGLAWIFIATASRALLPGQRVMRDTTLRILVFSWGFASHMAINEDCKGRDAMSTCCMACTARKQRLEDVLMQAPVHEATLDQVWQKSTAGRMPNRASQDPGVVSSLLSGPRSPNQGALRGTVTRNSRCHIKFVCTWHTS